MQREAGIFGIGKTLEIRKHMKMDELCEELDKAIPTDESVDRAEDVWDYFEELLQLRKKPIYAQRYREVDLHRGIHRPI
ncbi:hypothetical protein M422DRAFT_252042 [Sphaerobolus stellatus SS14]|uniref:Uncharacterized protein n=1 Tax=Sphaerobolus stellatus (strain SS14) TaxID=990650 RepID=A0A0C9VQ98_SPHS4|nr:hypothetical protein M422DRAFT_252042 [Sphaerobolus stellatus SS14]